MIIIALLISVSLTIALIFLGIFYWNVKSGQYDDTVTPSIRILFEDKPVDAEKRKTAVTRKKQ
jgi:cbb3-type cytochrome oxidase maturation protein